MFFKKDKVCGNVIHATDFYLIRKKRDLLSSTKFFSTVVQFNTKNWKKTTRKLIRNFVPPSRACVVVALSSEERSPRQR